MIIFAFVAPSRVRELKHGAVRADKLQFVAPSRVRELKPLRPACLPVPPGRTLTGA